MDHNIVRLNDGVPDIPGHPVQAIIDQLEELLMKARAGELVAFGYVSMVPNGALGSGWELGQGQLRDLLAGLVLLQKRIVDCYE